MTTFRGTVSATAFVLDVHVIGEEEARARVLDLWQPGARIYETPTGSWLVALAEPREVRAERAPGLPLTEVPDGLRPLDCAQWTDVGGLTRYALTPADLQPRPDPIESAVPETPELRARGGIGSPSHAARKLVEKESSAAPWAFVIVIGAVTLVVALTVFKPWVLIAFIVAFAVTRVVRGSTGRAVPAAEHRNLWVRLVMHTPLRALVRSQHEKYLRRLTEQFQRKDWANALRDAIGVGGDFSGRLSLKTPARRTGDLRPTTVLTPGAGPFYGADVQRHLRDLYEKAAEELERLGRHDEAAFVHADLLGDPAAAVALFERLGRFSDAAELAEGRDLGPDLVVRLWWRAKNRTRAIDVARARGAFAAAIARMPAEDGRELRAEWVRERQEAGDHLGAVAAAWPDDATRPLALPSIQAGMALGGPASSALLAHLVVGWPSPGTHSAALGLLDSSDHELVSARRHFVTAWLALEAPDRELGSAATRAFVRDGSAVPPSLRKAADPLLAADLPTTHKTRPAVPELTVPALPAQLVVHDAVALRGNAVLVALGDHGTRLVTGDGRTRARWDVPAHQLVIADHGGSALLVARRGTVSEVHQLDLATRKVRHWTTLAHRTFAGSFDGGVAIVTGPDGLEFLDVRRTKPTVVWRELDRDASVLELARNESSLAVVFQAQGDEMFENWRWDLPDLTLRQRGRTESLPGPGTLLPSGLYCEGTADGDAWFVPREEYLEIRTRKGVVARTTAAVHEIRWHAGLVTLIDVDSRVLALDTTTGEQVAAFALKAR